jgi:SAM-dependent methyltransferase
MSSKPNKSAAGFKQKLKGLLHPHRQMEQKMDDINAQLHQLVSIVSMMNATLHQLISIGSMKYSLPPIPPRKFQIRVAGDYTWSFFNQGKDMFHDLDDLLRDHGLSIFDFTSILDFGCGCGRFLIPMSLMMDPKKLSGTDIDAQAIQWLRRYYPCFKDLDVNGCAPPTKYADGAFDFVYSVSIFTHLPEEMQHVWLKELSRIIKPGGYGIFTTHGEDFFQNLPETALKELMEKGFYYWVGNKTDGLPDFYRTSFHTHEYIKREWARYFDVIDIRKKVIGEDHDAVLVRTRQ